MALELKVEKTVLSDGTKLFFTDKTGEYSALNTGGYGSPNSTRASIALVFYALKIPFTGEPVHVSENISYVDYDPAHENDYESVFELPYTTTSDGWYQYYLVALPTSVGSPVTDSLRYNTSTEIIEIYDGNSWEVLTDFSKLINEVNPYVFEQDIIFINLIQKYNCMMEQYFNCIQCTSCNCDKVFTEIQKLKLLMQSIDYLFNSSKEFEAVKVLEKGNKEFANCCK